jgi:hypothetical protein
VKKIHRKDLNQISADRIRREIDIRNTVPFRDLFGFLLFGTEVAV